MFDYILRTSLDRRCTITIIYSRGDEITKRNIRVLELDGENVKAYCYLRRQIRVFKKGNIMAAEIRRQYNGSWNKKAM